MDQRKLQPQQKEYISSVDGKKDVYFVREAGKGKDCIVFLHGHGGHGDQIFTHSKLETVRNFLAEKTVNIISPELRGNAWMNPAAVSDLAEILLREKENLQFRKCIFASASMGGTGALIFGMCHPEMLDALIVLGGVSDLRRYREWCAAGDLAIHREIAAAITAGYTEDDLTLHSVWAHPERLTMPLRFYHSVADRVMPVSEMRYLREKMKDSADAGFVEVPALEVAPDWWSDHDAPVAYFAEALCEFLA